MFPHITCMCTSHIDARNQQILNKNVDHENSNENNDNMEEIANDADKTILYRSSVVRRRQRVESLWVIRVPKPHSNTGCYDEELVGHGNQKNSITVATTKSKRELKRSGSSGGNVSVEEQVVGRSRESPTIESSSVLINKGGGSGGGDITKTATIKGDGDSGSSGEGRKCCGGSSKSSRCGYRSGKRSCGGGGGIGSVATSGGSGGIKLCHRLTTQSSTTSDIHQQSTSVTVETIATSSGGYIVSSRQGSIDNNNMQKCGLCSLLSRLLRRAMCVGSRRGSGESYYQELAETAASPPSPKTTSFKHAQDIATMETTDSSIYIRLIPASNQQEEQRRQSSHSIRDSSCCVRRRMSDTDQDHPLLEALLYEDKTGRRHVCNGRFLTMHKRRRKKLTTRSLQQDPAILDDILHGQVQCILNQVGNWRFNAFTLETVTGGRSLPVLCVHLFHWYGLLDHFNLDVVRLWKLFTLIEEGYHSTNPYHNSVHATDVTQAMHCFLQERKILENLEPIEIMASLIGAVTHDLDHPGVNQPFLIATSNHLAALYENTSVLENHHWRSAVGCLLESGVAEQIQDIRPNLEKQIASLILATDITRQTEFLTKFREYLDQNTLDMKKPDHRHFILQISLKCADISNPCRPWDISKKWSQKVCEEFFRQGDYERQLNLPVTSLCDRFSTSVPKIQVGFFKFVVTPLFDEWHRFLNTKLSTKMMNHLKENQIQWENKVAAELAEETKTEISDAEVLDEDVDDDDEPEINVELSDSSEVLIPEIKLPRRSSLQVPKFGTSRFDRRHSVPANPPKIILPTKDDVTRSAIREDIESRLDDTFSLLSSDSGSGPRKSSTGSVQDHERPLSAETLVPELNIATMSGNSDCADRLNIVMHGGSSSMLSANSASKQLIRQQTFPPIQPYVRTRYMSATAEMSTCSETLEKRSSSSDSQTENEQRGVLKSSKKDCHKREKDIQEEKSCKMAKLSVPGQKENLDPTTSIKRNLSRRRGSAPVAVAVALPPKTTADEPVSIFIRTCDKFMRRGSVPADIVHLPSHEKQFEKLLLGSSNTTSYLQRRGSVPCENVSSMNRTNNCNGKTRNRKKVLRRRSSGGAEILSPILAEQEPSCSNSSGGTSGSSHPWYRFKRTDRQKADIESLLTRRRGSLPVEVLAVCHTGTLRH